MTPAAGERLESLDVLRGLAVLGILMVNAPVFALPGRSSTARRPRIPFEGLSVVLWWTMPRSSI